MRARIDLSDKPARLIGSWVDANKKHLHIFIVFAILSPLKERRAFI